MEDGLFDGRSETDSDGELDGKIESTVGTPEAGLEASSPGTVDGGFELSEGADGEGAIVGEVGMGVPVGAGLAEGFKEGGLDGELLGVDEGDADGAGEATSYANAEDVPKPLCVVTNSPFATTFNVHSSKDKPDCDATTKQVYVPIRTLSN